MRLYLYPCLCMLHSVFCILAHLNPCLRQANLDGQLLPGEHVRVVGPAERLLQLLQLEAREGRPVPPLLPHLGDAILVPEPDLGARVGPRGAAGGAGPQDLRRVPPAARVAALLLLLLPPLLLLPLPLQLLGVVALVPGGGLAQAHDVGDEEGPVGVAELAAAEVLRGGLGGGGAGAVQGGLPPV